MTTYMDANLCNDMTTGRAVTGVLHLLNQRVIDAFSKKQPIVETVTHRSEFMAAWVVTEQIMELHTTLQYLGVKVHGPTYMFGDNKTVVDLSKLPSSCLHNDMFCCHIITCMMQSLLEFWNSFMFLVWPIQWIYKAEHGVTNRCGKC